METAELPVKVKKKLVRRPWFWILIGIAFHMILFGSCVFGTRCAKNAYDRKMRGSIDPYGSDANATGSKVTGYNEDESRFSDKYLPSDLKAKNPDEVRYIFLWKSAMETQTAGYQVGFNYKSVSGKLETLTIRLIDYKTGKEIVSKKLWADPPERIDANAEYFPSQNIKEETVQNWLKTVIENQN